MALKVTAVVAAALVCFSSLLCSFAHAHDHNDYLFVEGKVYCDPCRVQFFTKLSEHIEGATVKLMCKERENGSPTYMAEAVTDKEGNYKFAVTGDHEGEICEVQLVKSPNNECADPVKGKARIVLTKNNGMAQSLRFANPLAFMKAKAAPGCAAVLVELGLSPLDFNLQLDLKLN